MTDNSIDSGIGACPRRRRRHVLHAMRQPATRRFEVLLPLRSTGRRSDIRCEPSRFSHAANPVGTRRAGSGPGGSPCPDPCRLVRSPRSGSSRYDACPGTSDSTRRKPASARFRFPEHASRLRAGDVESPGGAGPVHSRARRLPYRYQTLLRRAREYAPAFLRERIRRGRLPRDAGLHEGML